MARNRPSREVREANDRKREELLAAARIRTEALAAARRKAEQQQMQPALLRKK